MEIRAFLISKVDNKQGAYFQKTPKVEIRGFLISKLGNKTSPYFHFLAYGDESFNVFMLNCHGNNTDNYPTHRIIITIILRSIGE